MPDPILITVLITTIGGLLSQLLQIYLDYKHAEHNNHDYFKSVKSNCCSTITEVDDNK
jgi:hypothetical protein